MIVAVEDIISKNADLENIIKDTDLVRCHVKVCDWFSKNKEYIKQRTAIGATPLFYAVFNRQPKVVAKLLEAGADVNDKTETGATS